MTSLGPGCQGNPDCDGDTESRINSDNVKMLPAIKRSNEAWSSPKQTFCEYLKILFEFLKMFVWYNIPALS